MKPLPETTGTWRQRADVSEQVARKGWKRVRKRESERKARENDRVCEMDDENPEIFRRLIAFNEGNCSGERWRHSVQGGGAQGRDSPTGVCGDRTGLKHFRVCLLVETRKHWTRERRLFNDTKTRCRRTSGTKVGLQFSAVFRRGFR